MELSGEKLPLVVFLSATLLHEYKFSDLHAAFSATAVKHSITFAFCDK